MLSDKQIKDILKQEKIKTLYLQFADINGKIKTLSVPASQIDEVLENKITFDGSSLSGFRENETLDLTIVPDKSTFMTFPIKFSNLKNTARFICDIHNAARNTFCRMSEIKY